MTGGERKPSFFKRSRTSDVVLDGKPGERWLAAREKFLIENQEHRPHPHDPYKFAEQKSKQGLFERARHSMEVVRLDFENFINEHESSDEWGDPTKTDEFIALFPALDSEVKALVLSYAKYLYDLHLRHPGAKAVEIAESTVNMPSTLIDPRDEYDPVEEMQETAYIPLADVKSELAIPAMELLNTPQTLEGNMNVGAFMVQIDNDFAVHNDITPETYDAIVNSSLPHNEKELLFQKVLELINIQSRAAEKSGE